MPYGRRRWTNRRSRYGSRRTLTTRSIYTRRSNLAQATQIAALKRKVNKVYKACKPEIKVNHGLTMDKDFSNSSFADTWAAWAPSYISQGPGLNERVGNRIYRRDTYKFVLTYSNNASSSSGLHNNETALGYVRIICGIWNEPKSDASIPSAESIIYGYGTSATNYNVNLIQPLGDGVTQEHRIVYDKVHKVDLSNPSVIVKIKTPWYLQVYDQNNNSKHSWIMCITGDLDWDSTFGEWIECHGVKKTVFKDA